MRRMAENVKAMKELWTKDEAQFHGEYVDFGSSWAWPKPAQSPHPPVLVGGMGPRWRTGSSTSATSGRRRA